jgi:hypothetical protein
MSCRASVILWPSRSGYTTVLSEKSALAAPSLAQAPATRCCEMKVVSAQDDAARLTITVANLNQASVGAALAWPELDFKVRIISETGQEPWSNRAREAPAHRLHIVGC